MGCDATSRWVFAGDRVHARARVRDHVCAIVRRHFLDGGYERVRSERAADRSFAIGPPARWIWIGDSRDTIDSDGRRHGDPAQLRHKLDLSRVAAAMRRRDTKRGRGRGRRPAPAPERSCEPTPEHVPPGELAPLLSRLLAPVIQTRVSDDAIIQFTLFERGEEVDRYANGKSPWYCFKSEEEAAPFRPHPERWGHLLSPGRTVAELAAVWKQAIGRWPDGDEASFRHVKKVSLELFDLDFIGLMMGYTYNPEGVCRPYYRARKRFPRHEYRELHFRRPGSPGRGDWRTTRDQQLDGVKASRGRFKNIRSRGRRRSGSAGS